MHTAHPDISEEGLADGCDECARVAANPLVELDPQNMQALILRTLSDRFGAHPERPLEEGEARLHARSNAEAVAMANVMTLFERFGRMVETAPRAVEWYLRSRWHVEVTIGETPLERAAASLRERL